MGFEFGILGPLEVSRDGTPLAIDAAKQRVLVASLLLDANRVVPVETLVARLWGDDPPGGVRNTLQNYVLRVRRLLGGTGAECPLLSRPGGYLLRVAEGALDLHRFDALVGRAADADDPERAAALLGAALALWRGEPLAGLPSERLQQEVAPALAERRLTAVEARIEAELRLGRHRNLLPELRELTGAHPLQERFWAQRMLALYRSGRQSEALHCFHAVGELLAEELGVDPGEELRRLHQRMLTADPSLNGPVVCRGVEQVTGNLPAEMTTFVGRERQLAQAGQLLETSRLVTLTGVGGVGKTRLALRTAAQVSAAFPDGVWLVDLAPLTEPGLLELAVAEALGLRDQSARPGVQILVEHLRGKRVLLVLDNCEHVVAPVAALTGALLRALPGLRVLATSRQRLGVQGEHVLTVPPLTVPGPGDDGSSPIGSEAVRLLADRAVAAAPGFRITDDNREAVVQLCRRLDGIPLAVELAAVRLGTLSVAEILERLDDRFRLLTGDPDPPATPRYQRTLQGVVDWSHELCTEQEQWLWARLSVFAGGFDLTAAEVVCSGDGIDRNDVIDLLAGLVHKSIVIARTGAGRSRYRLLETIRQYGGRRLHGLGQDAALRHRHRDHYQGLAAGAAADWCGPREGEWLSRLRRELPNLRAAMDFCVTWEGQARSGLEIAVNLTRAQCWFFCGTPAEGRHWLERTLAAQPRSPDALRASGAALVTWIALSQGDRRAADVFLADCRDLADRLPGDNLATTGAATGATGAGTGTGVGTGTAVSAAVEAGTSVATVTLGEGAHAMLAEGDPRAIELLARARDRFRLEGEVGDHHLSTLLWAMAAAFLGDRDTALAAGREYLAEAEAHQAAWAISWALWGLGLAELRHGDPHRAARLFRDSVRRQRDLDDRWSPTWGVEVLAWTAAATGDHDQAARLLGAAHALRRSFGVMLAEPFHRAHLDADGLVRKALGAEAYATAFKQGAGADDPIALALTTN
ncbi:SARP family transcriptional regulator [Microtetraspora sp. NBRC 13810]|uniref:BTAD domain-containing putative transcriptional regulator n=1 Tax=Microtetraspora sp. NBRC 13810 TaxID=3030990 RepID=UPI0024A4A524|nr:BTAD domain-containing putative transcriptional regulator [Microtetraspora sp. NBRC 13810]GLW05273.1 SARP family transcriptional regulator [Microtetraspora sp. NBRC 13810]